MPRIARICYPGGFYHIYNRGLNKQPIFKQPADYRHLIRKLAELIAQGDWIIYAYCFMPNHYHLLLEEQRTPIAKLIGRLFTSYSLHFNRKYDRNGPLFQDRFKSKLVQKDTYFLQVSRYIHLNPVKDGLVRDPLAYPYSSLHEYVNNSHTNGITSLNKVERLIGNHPTAIADYLNFVQEGINQDLEEYNPFTQEKDIVGSTTFVTHRIRNQYV